MQIAIFNIPLTEGQSETDKLNKLLRGNRIVAIDKQLVTNSDGTHCWSFCVTYLPNTVETQGTGDAVNKQSQVDYKEVLTPEQFVKFDKLRQCRKELGNRLGMPVYAIFTNSELASMTTDIEDITEQNLLKIRGIGKGKIERFGREFLQLYEIICNEKSRESDGEDIVSGQPDAGIYQSLQGQTAQGGGNPIF
ncbi:MAG: HRDC domain-containing protein [bacterium]|nr:HRDC domain-containing protein [Candidatus Minthenecus merdequi]